MMYYNRDNVSHTTDNTNHDGTQHFWQDEPYQQINEHTQLNHHNDNDNGDNGNNNRNSNRNNK